MNNWAQINTVVRENASLNERCSKLEKTLAVLEFENNNRKLENDALEQIGRRNIFRVSGIPESENEDTDDIILHLASDMGVPMSSSDIDRSHRVGKLEDTGRISTRKSKKSSRDIIVKFSSYNARRRLFQIRKELRTTENEDFKKIFINEDLTKLRSEILFEARNLRRVNKPNSAYSSDGKLFVRDKKDKKYQLSSLNDLVQFGYIMKPDDVGVAAPTLNEAEPSTSGVGARAID